MSSQRKVVHTVQAPAAVGPYSQAIVTGGFVFTAGQVGLDPATGKLVAGDVAAQTEQVLANLEAILTAAGSAWPHVAKATIFLTRMADFATVNEIYGRVFPQDPPARSTVAVLELPLGARVEIDVVARVP
jgi:2-iminobutanoate/2-iminopropanoate deaminase